jgi:hypothetical protein
MGQAVGLDERSMPDQRAIEPPGHFTLPAPKGQPMSAQGNALGSGYGETTGSQAANQLCDVTQLNTHGKGGQHFMIAMPPGHFTLPAPKGQPMSAQGNALGSGETTGYKAADHFRNVTKMITLGKGGHPFMISMPPGYSTLPAPKIWSAPSGLPFIDVSCPRAVPWAGMGQAVGLDERSMPDQRAIDPPGHATLPAPKKQPMPAQGTALGCVSRPKGASHVSPGHRPGLRRPHEFKP